MFTDTVSSFYETLWNAICACLRRYTAVSYHYSIHLIAFHASRTCSVRLRSLRELQLANSCFRTIETGEMFLKCYDGVTEVAIMRIAR